MLLRFKVEVNQHFLDELGVQIVIDKLSLTNLLPTVVNIFVEDAEGIRFAEGVHVWQLLALKAEGKLVREASTAETGRGEDGSVEIVTVAHLGTRCNGNAIEMCRLRAAHF